MATSLPLVENQFEFLARRAIASWAIILAPVLNLSSSEMYNRLNFVNLGRAEGLAGTNSGCRKAKGNADGGSDELQGTNDQIEPDVGGDANSHFGLAEINQAYHSTRFFFRNDALSTQS